MDAETRSRFIITSIDESPEQTRAILEAQRHSHTLDGIRRKKQREQVVQRHHAFQRLLKPVAVVNPFEPLLTYAENRLLVRRDNPKYLHLILAVTFLYQLQRPVKHDADAGDYIETTLDDIAIANELATDLFGQSLGELSRPSRELLKLIRRMTEEMERKPGRPRPKGGCRHRLRLAGGKSGSLPGGAITKSKSMSSNWKTWNTSCRSVADADNASRIGWPGTARDWTANGSFWG